MWNIIIEPKAQKEIRKLPVRDQNRVMRAMAILSTDPFPGKKLVGERRGFWSLRIWPYRIIYAIVKKEVTVCVVRVKHRQSVYSQN